MIVFAKERKISLDPKRNCTLSATAIQAKVNTTIQKVNWCQGEVLELRFGFRIKISSDLMAKIKDDLPITNLQ